MKEMLGGVVEQHLRGGLNAVGQDTGPAQDKADGEKLGIGIQFRTNLSKAHGTESDYRHIERVNPAKLSRNSVTDHAHEHDQHGVNHHAPQLR
jgi:hypothetical protein